MAFADARKRSYLRGDVGGLAYAGLNEDVGPDCHGATSVTEGAVVRSRLGVPLEPCRASLPGPARQLRLALATDR